MVDPIISQSVFPLAQTKLLQDRNWHKCPHSSVGKPPSPLPDLLDPAALVASFFSFHPLNFASSTLTFPTKTSQRICHIMDRAPQNHRTLSTGSEAAHSANNSPLAEKSEIPYGGTVSSGSDQPQGLSSSPLSAHSQLRSSIQPQSPTQLDSIHRMDSRESERREGIDSRVDTPINTRPERRVTVRSERSLRNTLPSSRNNSLGLLDGENGGHHNDKLSLLGCCKAILFATKLNILLVVIPVAIVAALLHWSDVAVFVLCFVAIVPLAKMLGYATEDLALRLGEVLSNEHFFFWQCVAQRRDHIVAQKPTAPVVFHLLTFFFLSFPFLVPDRL